MLEEQRRMQQQQLINKTILLVLVGLISCLFLAMIWSFLMPIFMASLFAAMLKPAHRWASDRLGGREYLASGLVLIAIVLLVLGPLGLLIGIVVGQAISVSQAITPWVQGFIAEPSAISAYLEKLPYFDVVYEHVLPYHTQLIEKTGQLVGSVSTFLIDSLSSVTMLTINAVVSSVIMLYVMFYFFIIGDALLVKILYFLPLRDEDERRLLQRLTSVTKATLKGTLIIGALQGMICGLAFALAGIYAPVFWGTLMAVASVIPAVGTALIWIPALIVLLVQGKFWGVAILVVLCGLVAGNLDNLLRPRLVGKDTQMHELFVLFGTLGGISMFGILGIIIGPIIAALFITAWDLYGNAFAAYLPAVGPSFTEHVEPAAAEPEVAENPDAAMPAAGESPELPDPGEEGIRRGD